MTQNTTLPWGKQSKKKIQSINITIFIRQLATLINAGIPLVQSLNIIGDGHRDPAMSNVIMVLKTQVESGESLTKALSAYPQYFNGLFCHLVNAGEQSGSLDEILSLLAIYRERMETLRKKIKKALTYPLTVLLLSSVITLALLVFIVPQFEEIFSRVGADLPLPTRLVLEGARVLQKTGPIILGIMLFIFYMAKRKLKQSEKWQAARDRITLNLPLAGGILQAAIISRLMRTLATTFAAGLPLVEALQAISGVADNAVFRVAIKDIKEAVSSGNLLQTALSDGALFPPMVIQMVGIGEASGTLEDMLNKIADFYEEEVNHAVENLSNLIEPIIILILGVIIGGLVIALYLPLFRMGAII